MTAPTSDDHRLPDAMFRRAADITAVEFDGDLVLTTDDGRYFALSGSSTRVWRWLQQPQLGHVLGQRIRTTFDTNGTEWEARTAMFLVEMTRFGLLVADAADSHITTESDSTGDALGPLAAEPWTVPHVIELRPDRALTGIAVGADGFGLLS